MRTRFAPVNQRKSLSKALKPYKKWDKWIKSPDCFLSYDEITLIEVYKKTGSYAACRERLYISIIEAANRLINIIVKLKTSLCLYEDWLQGETNLYEIVSSVGIRSMRGLKQISLNDLKNARQHPEYSPIPGAGSKKPP